MLKKVLQILNSSKIAGAEKIVVQLIESMSNDYIFAYCSLNGEISSVLKKRNIQYYPVEKLSVFQLRYVIDDFEPDIIHAHDYTASIFASAFFRKKKLISHIHHNNPLMRAYNLKSLLFSVVSLVYKKVIVVSSAVEFNELFYKINKNKRCIISNPIDKKEVYNLSLDKEKISFELIFIGRLEYEKNPEKFIEICYQLVKMRPNLKVAILGNGSRKAHVVKKINDLKLTNNIKMYGFQENPYKYLVKSKVLCITSHWEGFGLTAAEALVLGKPVVSTDCGGVSDFLSSDCGLISNEESAYVNELNLLLKDNEYYRLKSNYAKDYSAKILDINEYDHKIQCVYQEILEIEDDACKEKNT